MDPDEIAALIRTHLPDSHIEVSSPDQVHFEAVIVSPAFAGKHSLQRHRLVYAALGGRIGGEIHALSIKAWTPEEWQARAQ